MNAITPGSAKRSDQRAAPDLRLDPPEPPPRPKGPPRHSGPFGVLDIGTTKIACLIGRVESDGTPRVLGFGWQRGQGVRAGGIIDIEQAEKAIRAAVGAAEEMADTRLRAVTVNLSCGQPESRLFNVRWPVGGRAVTEADVRRVLLEGRARASSEGRHIIHAMPLNFAADETLDVTDPRGLFCDTLSARLHVVDALSTSLRTLTACLQRCDLGLAELVSAPMAAGIATLVEDEKQLGATVLDMGGGTTGMAVFAEGQLLHTCQIPIGGQHVTNDIARLLSTPVNHAERLKTLHGSARSIPDDEREMLPVKLVGEAEHQIAKVPRSAVVGIITPRLEETFEMVRERLDSFGTSAGQRVVLTGGGSQMAGVREMAAAILERQVRVGKPMSVRGLPPSASGAAFATAVGLLAWAGGEGRAIVDVDLDAEHSGGLLRRIVNFLRDRT
jgi:cell division protein FtsA